MKVAIVHDYIKEYGGAERVLESLHHMYPQADIFTLVYLPEFLGPHKKRFADFHIITSFAQHFPFKDKLISSLRIISPLLFKQFNFSGYDLIIVSATGAYFPNAIQKKHAHHICYCHTPPRYLYGYATARKWGNNPFLKIVIELINHVLRLQDFMYAKNVDIFIANSLEVQKRIEKFYRQKAIVIYPPVTLNNQPMKSNTKRTYFLAGGRFARSKHLDLIVKVCTQQKIPLKVFGRDFAGYEKEVQSIAGKTIEFLGEVTDEEKYALMREAKAFLFAGEDEDFGILPVEAMSMGTPVIAYRSGGVKETIIENKTGIFFNELTDTSLRKAIQQFLLMTFSEQACIKRAQEFSPQHFSQRIKQIVQSLT